MHTRNVSVGGEALAVRRKLRGWHLGHHDHRVHAPVREPLAHQVGELAARRLRRQELGPAQAIADARNGNPAGTSRPAMSTTTSTAPRCVARASGRRTRRR